MDKLDVHLEHCYGIRALRAGFNYSTHSTYAVYAPNGAMKTSFAKVFRDHANGQESKDIVFPNRKTIRHITIDDGADLPPEAVFVIDPYDQDFTCDKMSTLLVNKELRTKYDAIHRALDEEKEAFLREIKSLLGVRKSIEDDISLAFTSETGRLFDSLERIEKEVLDGREPEWADISYKEVFTDAVLAFLATPEIKQNLAEYIQKYEDLIAASTYFRRGVFNHNNAAAVAKNLADNGFFRAKHSVSLNSEAGARTEVREQKELERIVEQEKNAILTDPVLVKAFDKIDKKLTTKDLRAFRDYLVDHMKILPELQNVESFRQKLWISYIKERRDAYRALLGNYQKAKSEIARIMEKAEEERTQWERVVDIFNRRFSVPFVLIVENRADVILKSDVPSITFVFKDSEGEASVERTELLRLLSNGERRALYVLNMIFEVEARRATGQVSLFILDDVADSFDYKNKYAIIEYVKEMSEDPLFCLIILTHNFDFFRTIESRFVGRPQSLMVAKTDDKIELVEAAYLQPFSYFRSNFHANDRILVASIPFVRNLVQYTVGSGGSDFAVLTSLLHIKEGSSTVTRGDLKGIYEKVFADSFDFGNSTEPVLPLVFNLADAVAVGTPSAVNLENKIVLSLAIRLKAERFMLAAINNPEATNSISKNQTFELFRQYKQGKAEDDETVRVLGQVNLMTPENIHLNSFMYEPILDMSDDHLRRLYAEVGSLT
jgi:hypothetical protein